MRTGFLLPLVMPVHAVNQPYFPIFHIRPPAGHVNDPNGPFRDPKTGYVHLFMQYCPLGPCMNQGAPITPGEVPNYQSATHYYSKDLVRWTWTGADAGVVAGGKMESETDCPDDHGVYSGSTTLVDGVPHYAYPGVHLYNWTDGKQYVTMSQCTATPADPSDPSLAKWNKRTIITAAQIPKGVRQHFHDDSEAFKGQDGRWWMFMGTAACPAQHKPTGDCPFPDPSATDTHGVNYLFSSADFKSWRQEHSLVNTSGFVSCPEFFTLPGMKKNEYVYHAMGAKNAFGTFDPATVTFQPDSDSVGKYDNGDGHASKSYWDAKTNRRIMWSWIAGGFPCSNTQNLKCDSMQSVPREMTYSAALHTLIINPVTEITQLRQQQLLSDAAVNVAAGTDGIVKAPHSLTVAMDLNLTLKCTTTAGQCGGSVLLRASPDGSHAAEVHFSGQVGGKSVAVRLGTVGEQLQLDTVTVRGGASFDVPFASDETWDGTMLLRILVDAPVIEVYAMHGRAIGTFMYLPPDAASTGIRVRAPASNAISATLNAWSMGTAFA